MLLGLIAGIKTDWPDAYHASALRLFDPFLPGRVQPAWLCELERKDREQRLQS